MELTWPKGKTIRFDINLQKADDINNIPFTIDPNAAYGTAKKEDGGISIGIICRYKIYAVNSNNDEVFGYLRETESEIVSLGTTKIDLPILTKFCSDAFINVELDFQEKMRLPYNIFGYIRPSFDTLGESLLTQLADDGYYSS